MPAPFHIPPLSPRVFWDSVRLPRAVRHRWLRQTDVASRRRDPARPAPLLRGSRSRSATPIFLSPHPGAGIAGLQPCARLVFGALGPAAQHLQPQFPQRRHQPFLRRVERARRRRVRHHHPEHLRHRFGPRRFGAQPFQHLRHLRRRFLRVQASLLLRLSNRNVRNHRGIAQAQFEPHPMTTVRCRFSCAA